MGLTAKIKVPKELQERIWAWINEARWSWTVTGTQSEHHSDLSLTDHYIENEDEVIAGIVQEILKFYEVEVKEK